jgi:hypothetical protein
MPLSGGHAGRDLYVVPESAVVPDETGGLCCGRHERLYPALDIFCIVERDNDNLLQSTTLIGPLKSGAKQPTNVKV